MRSSFGNTHYLAGSSFHNLLHILFRNRTRVSPRYLPRIVRLLLGSLIFYPFCIIESIFFSKRIRRTRLAAAPVFIIGHWRSGTTYMHNLMSQDPRFAYPTTYQCVLPGMFLTGGNFLRGVMRKLLPEKRPMDNVRLDPDYPQEEEFAINASCAYSFYKTLCFPKQTKKYFEDYVLMRTPSLEKWEHCYSFFLKKVSYAGEGKPLILKNPVNTARIAKLAEMYPGAKFIYMDRDREEVLNSTYNLYQKFLELYALQNYRTEDIEANLVWIYEQTAAAYESQKKLIPAGHLIEVDYRELVKDPMKQLEQIYSVLRLGGLENCRERLKRYIETQRSYQPNTQQFLKRRTGQEAVPVSGSD